MSGLELAKVKLIDTIGKYNLTASNIAKFKLSQLEENLFATMMVEFAQELANDVPDNYEKALPINSVNGSNNKTHQIELREAQFTKGSRLNKA